MFYYRIPSTGEVLGAGQSAPQDDDWKERYAAALGITEALEEYESDADPRKPDARTEPVPVVAPTELQMAKAALDTRYDDLTAAATKELADKPATRDALIALVDALKQG